MKIALVGNPNCGKTTMFNDLTGAYQYVGNWPGVTVEKKTGKLLKHKDVEVVDLPGIYSLSPYTLEEVITRDYIKEDAPDVIINIVDATNLERNLYLTSQVLEMNVPTVIALNMMDMIKKGQTDIDVKALEEKLGVDIVPTAAVRGDGLKELISKAIEIGKANKLPRREYFNADIENALKLVANEASLDYEKDRYTVVKVFERDEKVLAKTNISSTARVKIEEIIKEVEEKLDDDAESIITTERYKNIQSDISSIVKKPKDKKLSFSDKVDKIVTNRFLAIPIFLAIMWFIYYVSISTLGDICIGIVEGIFENIGEFLTTKLPELGASDIVVSLVNDGIVQPIGSIFTFVPQLMMLFFFLSLLEDSGYMARVAFIMDKLFRKFGLSGKSFIPMLIGTGCSIPGVMATRTIEADADRRMTILLTPFIPCGAKLPIFAMFITLMFRGASWIAPLIYVIAIIAVIIAGIILKRSNRFKGDPAPFVMELPPYRIPTIKNVIIHMWEKGKSFIIKAGTVILLACFVLWFLQSFNFRLQWLDGDIENSMLATIGSYLRYIFVPLGFGDSWAPAVATITGLVAKEVVVATFASVGAKAPIYFSQVTAFAFIIFTMFAAPCFAAIGAMRRELGNRKDTWFTIIFQTGLAYVLALIVNVVGNIIFKGTELVKKVPLDYEAAEEASEAVDVQGNLVLYVLAGLVVVAVVGALLARIKQRQKYKKVA